MSKKEEVKQWLRIQIDSSLKIQSKHNENRFFLSYNNSYLRALKLSKITGQPVNQNNFTGGDQLFGFNTKDKLYWYHDKIADYLIENYSNDYDDRKNIIEEVFNEYVEYKDYD